ncbi:MAG: hypothetical protein DMG65_24140 [Candidatus Angelobacter sp. Gp1-AA117]|nr:MAG: hypothetical protein DMG65_24140 [Candidatus Angelobacter sp. Gp1-AA117]
MKVGPMPETQVPVVFDSDTNGFGGPLDMIGPQVGLIAYSEPGGNLHIRVNIEFAFPSTTYEVFLVGGPAHNVSTGFIVIGTLVTDAVGSGSGSYTVGHATLLAAPFGPGYRTDHIDLLHAVGDLSKGTLTAGAINYFVCREANQTGAAGLKLAETVRGKAQSGDPHGEKVTGNDPLTTKKK